MKHLLIFKLDGNFSTGFTVTLEMGEDGKRPLIEIQEKLLSAPILPKIYQIWSKSYRSLDGKNRLEVKKNQTTNVNLGILKQKCQQQSKKLETSLNTWLSPQLFTRLKEEYKNLKPNDEVRVIIRTSDVELRKIPWHLCKGWSEFPQVEIALSSPEAKRRERTYQQTIRVLIILGNSEGIDIKEDEKILKEFCQEADLVFLNEPTLEDLKKHLLDKRGWDILFFSGHSQTELSSGIIHLNKTDSLNIQELKEELHTAITGGLQVALFNSCDGLGIAQELEALNIPQVIVMREPIPNQVAEHFLKHFIKQFTTGKTLYQAVRIARQELENLEEEFPCASWLPVIVQNILEIPPTWQSLGAISHCPYRGLAPFRQEDTAYFFGREQLTQKLAEVVKIRPLVAVVGSSGSGKSSLVLAGLIPHLVKETQLNWSIISCRPGKNPFESLAVTLISTLSPELENDSKQLLKLQLEIDKERLQAFFLSHLQLEQNNQRRFLLVIDQFEELYTLNTTNRQIFLDGLLNAVRNVPGLTILLTLRADCYGEILSYAPLAEALQDRIINLAPMTLTELQQAIARPAQMMNVELEDGLIDSLVKTVLNSPGDLTLLEFALTQLWASQREHTLTHRGYQSIGGVEGAIANHAEAVYEQLNTEDRKRVEHIFTQLVQTSEQGIINTRRLANRGEITEDNWDLVRHLASVRLVVTNRNEYTGEETVELIHEALIRYWGRLITWIDSAREFRQWQEQLRLSLREWKSNNQDKEALLQGIPLTKAEEWLQQSPEKISSEEKTYIKESLRVKKQKELKTIWSLTGGLIIVSLLAILSSIQWHRAEIQRQQAIKNKIEAISATSKLLFDSGQSLAALQQILTAAIEAKKAHNLDPETMIPLVTSLQEIVYGIKERNLLEEHKAPVSSLSYSRNGEILVSADRDNQIKVWQSNGKLLQTIYGDNEQFHTVILSPNAQTLVSASFNKGVKFWQYNNTIKRFTSRPYLSLNQQISAVAWSPDSKNLLVGMKNGQIQLYNPQGKLIKAFTGHKGLVYSLSFSPDNQVFASAGKDKKVKLWRSDGVLLQTLQGHKKEVVAVNFSPKGDMLASAGEDKTIKIWNKQGQLLHNLEGHQSGVLHLNFSPNGQLLASAGEDKTVRVWQIKAEKEVEILRGHSQSVSEVMFSPDGKTLASVSLDKTMRLWDINNHVWAYQEVTSFDYSPNGHFLAIGNKKGKVILLDKDQKIIRSFSAHKDEIIKITVSDDGHIATTDASSVRLWTVEGKLISNFVAQVSFSHQGKSLATVSPDNKVSLWGLDGKLLGSWQTGQQKITSLSFSPDGKNLLTGDTVVKIQSLEGRLLHTLPVNGDNVLNIVYSTDGQMIATATAQKTVKLWFTDGRLFKTLPQNERVSSLGFIPNSQVLVTGLEHGTVTILNVEGKLLQTLPGHQDLVTQVTISPDGQSLASLDINGRLMLRDLDIDSLVDKGCNWLKDYLSSNPHLDSTERDVCKLP